MNAKHMHTAHLYTSLFAQFNSLPYFRAARILQIEGVTQQKPGNYYLCL
jgi:hypothetical protein